MSRALSELVEVSRSLPWPGVRAAATPLSVPAIVASAGAPPLGGRLAALLTRIAARLEPMLSDALARAGRAWDQVDAAVVLDDELRAEIAALRAACADGGPDALLVALTLESAVGLTTLVERRLATLVRLRARSRDPLLLVDGRPFLDVARALQDTARRWA